MVELGGLRASIRIASSGSICGRTCSGSKVSSRLSVPLSFLERQDNFLLLPLPSLSAPVPLTGSRGVVSGIVCVRRNLTLDAKSGSSCSCASCVLDISDA